MNCGPRICSVPLDMPWLAMVISNAGTTGGKRIDRHIGERPVDAVEAGDDQQDADRGQQELGIDPERDARADRRCNDPADEEAKGGDGERGPAKRGDEGRRNGQRDEEFGGVDGADHPPRLASLGEQIAGHDRAPAAAAGRIEEAAGEAQRSNDLGRDMMRRMVGAAPHQQRADRRQIGKDERLDDVGMDVAQHISADNAADDPGDRDPAEQAASRHSCAGCG